ncbi:hypothetical protein [Pseudomonas sp. NPDC088890]|uniref:hypothetical protein n=1 Tax=Pseudomonas sp. NPDC088890 TaxID=3364458 RepID=UPI00384A9629
MFDDYDFKGTSTRISLKFVQIKDEPMYPWEIASFLNKLNTAYYKFELLNSICSALAHGILPEHIFIFDHSLPLYKQYSEMNLLSEPNAAKTFYPIGMPIPLIPSKYVYDLNCFYQAFQRINSTLKSNHVQPFRRTTVASAFEVLQSDGLEAAEQHIIELAKGRAALSYENAMKRGEKRKEVDPAAFENSLEKYRKSKATLFSDLDIITNLSDEEKEAILSPEHKSDRRIKKRLSEFFTTFDATTRPLVCARVGNNYIRVLGRSLVNKREQTGLELKEAKRNSPLGAFIEGGLALYQTINQERRAKELHELDLKRKEEEIKLVQAQIRGQELINLETEIKISESLNDAKSKTDLSAIQNIPDSPMRRQIAKAYSIEHANAGRVITEQGMYLDRGSVTISTNA